MAGSELCFPRDSFADPRADGREFSADQFIAEWRARVPLETLLSDLKSHASSLRSRLFDVVQDHYASFVGLSDDLGSLSSRLDDLRPTLSRVRSVVAESRATTDAALREARALEARWDEARARVEVLGNLRDVLRSLGALETELGAGGGADLERCADLASHLAFLFEDQRSTVRSAPLLGTLRERLGMAQGALRRRLVSSLHAALKSNGATPNLECCVRAAAAMGEPAIIAAVWGDDFAHPLLSSPTMISPEQIAKVGLEAVLLQRVATAACSHRDDLLRLHAFAGVFVKNPEPAAMLSKELLCKVRAVVEELLGNALPQVFSPAIADVFHRNYRVVERFVAQLRDVLAGCGVPIALSALGSSHMSKRWNTSLYFHIQAQEITVALETALALPKQVQLGSKGHGLAMEASRELVTEMRKCFDPATTFLSDLAPQFVRLAARMVRRWCRWVSAGMSSRTPGSLSSPAMAPVIPGLEMWAHLTIPECLVPYFDARGLSRLIETGDFYKPAFGDNQAVTQAVSAVFADSIEQLRGAQSEVEQLVVHSAAQQCVNGIHSVYSSSSSQVSSIKRVLDPLRDVVTRVDGATDEKTRWAGAICDEVFGKWVEISAELVMGVYRADHHGAASAASDQQMLRKLDADIKEFAKHLQAEFAVDCGTLTSFQRLQRCVTQALS